MRASAARARSRRSALATPRMRRPNSTFWRAVIHANSAYSWNTTPRSGPGLRTGAPRKRTSPSEGRMKPASRCSSVVLPQPEGPIRQTNSPSAMRSETCHSAQFGSPSRVANIWDTRSISIRSGTLAPRYWPAAGDRRDLISSPLSIALCNIPMGVRSNAHTFRMHRLDRSVVDQTSQQGAQVALGLLAQGGRDRPLRLRHQVVDEAFVEADLELEILGRSRDLLGRGAHPRGDQRSPIRVGCHAGFGVEQRLDSRRRKLRLLAHDALRREQQLMALEILLQSLLGHDRDLARRLTVGN